MTHLPTEIIIIIFQYLPQKYIKIGSTICKEWYEILLSQPQFYKTIHIYSFTQLDKCIKIAKTKKAIDNKPFSHHVENIHFHTDSIFPTNIIADIVTTFPNLLCIHDLHKGPSNHSQFSLSRMTFPQQSQLLYIYHWCPRNFKQWITLVDNHSYKMKSLEFSMDNELFVLNIEKNRSSIPIIHYTSISTVPPTIRIHKINLPMMPCLTHLSIDCFFHKVDENIFESIHQSCPQLRSLHLNSFCMYISHDYHDKMVNQLFEPNLNLKEFHMHNELIDSRCYDYLSFKYPNLESISLDLYKSWNSEPTTLLSFQVAIFKMITQYDYLQKLKLKLGQYNYWSHNTFFKWLQDNPKLSHLEYPYDPKVDILETNTNNNNNDGQSNVLPFTATFGHLPIQRHEYLNHLYSLSLGTITSNAIDSLFYFYLCNNNNNVISNSIEELNLIFGNFGNIYFWLNGFPNLKSLSIKGNQQTTHIIDGIDTGDDYKYNNSIHYQKILPYLKEKMKQQEQLMKDSQTSKSSSKSKDIIRFFKLKKIEIRYCYVSFEKYGWNGLFKRLPDLKTIILSNVNEVITGKINNQRIKKIVKPPARHATLDLSHLSLDFLKISHFNLSPCSLWKGMEKHCVKNLMINETSLDKIYYVGGDNFSSKTPSYHEYSTTLTIKCKWVDYIDFHNF
ncbi:unnamed protein product [Cunninghamella blakesleeana]